MKLAFQEGDLKLWHTGQQSQKLTMPFIIYSNAIILRIISRFKF